jgi:lambda family phage minor tail protein L
MTLASIAHLPNPGEIVFLFRIDVTSAGGGVNYFTQGKVGADNVVFGGQEYTAVDIHLSEFDTNAGGVLPTPKIQISNTNSVIQAMVNTYGDLCGCEVRRVRTFKRFLDGQPKADPSAFMGPDVFKVERKTSENPIFIEWELSAAIDQEGKMIPGRQVIRDACTQRYRAYNPADPRAALDGFIYPTINPCPYTGTSYFDSTGNPTTIDKDACGRKLTDCQLRFGAANPLPFGGFPGCGRVHQ